MKCPFCLKELEVTDYVKRCKNCKNNYSEINTSIDKKNNVNITYFNTNKFKIETYENELSSVTKITENKKNLWINGKIKITEYNIKKINDKIKKLFLFM